MNHQTADRAAYAHGAAFVDGRYVPVGEARVPILDWGFVRSDATYDVAHVWRGSFFRLEDHLDRFERGVARLHMHLPYDRGEIREILSECVRLGGLRDAYAEIICTRGVPPPGSRDPRECENRFYAFVVPFVWIADPEKQAVGLHAVISDRERIRPESVDPTVKNYHWLDLTGERRFETCSSSALASAVCATPTRRSSAPAASPRQDRATRGSARTASTPSWSPSSG